MTNYDKIFNSKSEKSSKLQLANGYISTTNILFEEEKIVVKIDADGTVGFLDLEDKVIASISIPEQTGGKQVYTELMCSVEADFILLKFPIVEWIDNYPHCDGEYDRWDSKIIGYHNLDFDLKTNQIILKVV